ncbi:glucosaminidase domain-containing protein [Alphaproteobacteria bacterium]|nr:glucosaminidase domain-containing protein [Alphaproteobacteria bacterium]
MADLNSEHKRWSVNSWLLGVLIILIIGQGVLILGAGLSYVPIKSGYYEPLAADQDVAASPSRERLLWLEKQLAPPPLLVWSDTPPDFDFASVLNADKEPGGVAGDLSSGQANGDETKASVGDIASLSLSDMTASGTESDAPQLSQTHSLIAVDPDYIKHLPDLRMMDVEERKSVFIASVLPLILRANEELLMRREIIKRDYAQGNEDRLRRWAELYLIDGVDEDDDVDNLYAALLVRVDAVPVSLALAQAIVESGWGTSRFARQGNALFGQWAWSEHKGIKPYEPSNDRAVVRSFPTLFDSVRAYMHNLNTHFAYEEWRLARAENRNLDQSALALRLIPELERYSEDGQIYIRKLGNLIRTNNLQYYNDAQLTQGN